MENYALGSNDVSETLLIPLYYRALETPRQDAILKDEQAVELVRRLDYDFGPLKQIRTHEGNKVARFMLTRELDHYTRNFLERHPDAVVAHIGCGLDSRFERVDNDQWGFFDSPEPRLARYRWAAPLFWLFKPMRILHYRLGDKTDGAH